MKFYILFLIFTIALSCHSNRSPKVKIHEITIGNSPEERSFINFWKEFSVKFNSLDTTSVRKIALDSIWLWGDKIPLNEFIDRYRTGYLSTDFSGILDTSKIQYGSIGCLPNPIPDGALKQQYSKAYSCRQAAIIQDTVGSIIKGKEFTFLETSIGYRLFGLNYCSYYWRTDGSLIDTTSISQ